MSNFGQGSFLVTYTGSNLVLSNFDPVPEPSTWALIIAGLGIAAFTTLRRKK
ncbi:MAG: PEP-CTERM sorting domain-containing protein [Opitutus sp.]|nr:PEP-CTERM sorting domain-containing protein [Opitutus sp.]